MIKITGGNTVEGDAAGGDDVQAAGSRGSRSLAVRIERAVGHAHVAGRADRSTLIAVVIRLYRVQGDVAGMAGDLDGVAGDVRVGNDQVDEIKSA